MPEVADKLGYYYMHMDEDIAWHRHDLLAYGEQVDDIVELGVRNGNSMTAWLLAKPKRIRGVDIAIDPLPAEKKADFEEFAKEHGIDLTIIHHDSRTYDIGETDLLFIDTRHTYDTLNAELAKHGNDVRMFIIIHDTEAYFLMQPAIDQFLAGNSHWSIREVSKMCNGLTVLERK